jgi:hypothetical protein
MRRALLVPLLLAAFAFSALPAFAQQEAAPSGASSEDAGPFVVEVTIRAELVSKAAVPQLPMALIQEINDQPPLRDLEVQANARETALAATFRFRRVDAFRAWYEGESAQALLRRLNEGENQTRVRMKMQKSLLQQLAPSDEEG